MLAYFLVWAEKPRFYGQAYLKTLALTGFTRLFQATLSWLAQPIPWQAGLAMLLTALLMQGLKGIKTAHVCLLYTSDAADE